MADYFPLNFEKINQTASTHLPSAYKSRNNLSYEYWMRALFERARYVLDFTVPDDWKGPQKELMIYTLFKYGFGAVSHDSKFGYFFQPVQLSGYGFYYQPTEAILANPMLDKRMTIGTDCEIVKMTPDYRGIWDVLDYYATKLAGLDGSVQTALINSKNSYMLFARTKSAAQALKKALDLINQGEPAVVFDSRALLRGTPNEDAEPIEHLDLCVDKNVKVIADLIQDLQLILKMFDTEIGIQTSGGNIQKRLTSYEAESNQQECQARCTVWVEQLNDSFDRVSKLYPDLKLHVELNESAIYDSGEDTENLEGKEEGSENV